MFCASGGPRVNPTGFAYAYLNLIYIDLHIYIYVYIYIDTYTYTHGSRHGERAVCDLYTHAGKNTSVTLVFSFLFCQGALLLSHIILRFSAPIYIESVLAWLAPCSCCSLSRRANIWEKLGDIDKVACLCVCIIFLS